MQKLRQLVKSVLVGTYKFLRPVVPTTGQVRYAGIPIGIKRKLGEATFKWLCDPEFHDTPEYESTLIKALHEYAREGDRITVIGGGFGVTTVVSAQIAGKHGHVKCYEASTREINIIRRTLALNGVADRVEVHHTIVGPPIRFYGSVIGAGGIPAAGIADCDVLQMDCEGSEVGILNDLGFRPRVILVETHGVFGAPTAQTKQLLSGLGYMVADLGVAEPRLLQTCLECDVRVLAGFKS
jgi:hypothetical protein